MGLLHHVIHHRFQAVRLVPDFELAVGAGAVQEDLLDVGELLAAAQLKVWNQSNSLEAVVDYVVEETHRGLSPA